MSAWALLCGMLQMYVYYDITGDGTALASTHTSLVSGAHAHAGQLGSICSTDIVSVSGGPTPCLKGSYCRELLNGTLANTGLGFCAANPVTNSSSPSPFAGY